MIEILHTVIPVILFIIIGILIYNLQLAREEARRHLERCELLEARFGDLQNKLAVDHGLVVLVGGYPTPLEVLSKENIDE